MIVLKNIMNEASGLLHKVFFLLQYFNKNTLEFLGIGQIYSKFQLNMLKKNEDEIF